MADSGMHAIGAENDRRQAHSWQMKSSAVMYTRAFQNEVDVGKLAGHSIFPLFGSIEVHWYHFRRNPTIFRKAHGLQSFRVFLPYFGQFRP